MNVRLHYVILVPSYSTDEIMWQMFSLFFLPYFVIKICQDWILGLSRKNVIFCNRIKTKQYEEEPTTRKMINLNRDIRHGLSTISVHICNGTTSTIQQSPILSLPSPLLSLPSPLL